jgi:hypothetical protein
MTEILHINALYRIWDGLLSRFPHLIIDNCASGGRRNDIELLRRSMPLWRSDYQCPANHDPEVVQCHTVSYNSFLPYSGSGSGRYYDTYRFRSAMGASLTTNYTFFMREKEHLDYFCNSILPELVRRHQKDKTLAIWSAGCSSGEEPYNISMFLFDYLGAQAKDWDTRILATDGDGFSHSCF